MPLALQQDLVTSRNVVVGIVSDDSGAYQLGAGAVVRTTVENRDGRISIAGTIVDPATQQIRQVVRVQAPSSGGLLPAVNELAKRLNAEATYYSTKSERALRAFTSAAETPNLQNRIVMLENAIAADPAFGLAYIALTEILAQTGQDPAPLLEKAASHLRSFTPVDRVRFNAVMARMSHAPLPQLEQATSAVVKIAPNQLDTLVTLASDRFLLGDADGGERALKRAVELSPGNANLRQQLAVGLLETKQFANAEKVFQSIDNNPSILPALSVCILLEGDVTRADVVFNRYLALRPPADPVTPIIRAEWLALSGRRPQALQLLQDTAFPNAGVRAIALSQTAIWQLMTNDRAAAERSAASAFQLSHQLGLFALLITKGNAPAAEWRDQVNTSGIKEQTKQVVLGYGFFLNGRYHEAVQVWSHILQQSGGTDLRARAMLASSMDRASDAADARKVLVEPFVPEFGDLYAAVSFDEMHRLLGVGVR